VSTVGTNNERNRDLWVRRQLAALPEGWRILDAGAGEQKYRDDCSHLQYVSQDFGQYNPQSSEWSHYGLQEEKWNTRPYDHVCDICEIPEPDESFDAILCTEVFEHIPNPIHALTGFAQLLKPGGRLILSAPFTSVTHFAPYHFAPGFNRFFYEHHLPELGFKILGMDFNGNYYEHVAADLRMLLHMPHRYDHPLTTLQRRDIETVLQILQTLNERPNHTHELLCFNIMVLAEKLPTPTTLTDTQ
jgi:SAM-dependent methyltransferase